MKFLLSTLLALVLHLLLGWAWTVGAGVAAGCWVERRGWMAGGLAVGLSWLVLVVFNYIVAMGPVQRMTETLGGIMGNLPGAAVVAVTLCIGVLLGVVGGALGTQVRLLFRG